MNLLPASLFLSLPPYKPRSRVASQQGKNNWGAYFSIRGMRGVGDGGKNYEAFKPLGSPLRVQLRLTPKKKICEEAVGRS